MAPPDLGHIDRNQQAADPAPGHLRSSLVEMAGASHGGLQLVKVEEEHILPQYQRLCTRGKDPRWERGQAENSEVSRQSQSLGDKALPCVASLLPAHRIL